MGEFLRRRQETRCSAEEEMEAQARKAKVACSDCKEQLPLTLRAACPLLPPAVDGVGAGGGGEGGAASEEDVQQHTQAPQVAGLGVAQGSFGIVKVVLVGE